MKDRTINLEGKTIALERETFFRALKTNPRFLLNHIPALMQVMRQRYQSKRNRKKHPVWLPKTLKGAANHKICSTKEKDWWQRIPVRTMPYNRVSATSPFGSSLTTRPCQKNIHVGDETSKEYDVEDYLKAHRFSELILNLINVNQQSLSLPTSIENWLKSPPPKGDLAWETYSSCERIANLLSWITFIPMKERDALPREILSFLTSSLYWIYDHLEYYQAQTNNHILNNARALMMCASVLNHSEALAAAKLIFEKTLPVLIQKDGALRERSTHYQLIVLNWLLDAYYFSNQVNQQPSHLGTSAGSTLKEVIDQMAEAASIFCDEEGFLKAYIGDISPDLSPQLTSDRLKLLYPEIWPKKKHEHENKRISYKQYDDFYALNNHHHQIILNCPNGVFPQPYPTHAHNDLTSFIWLYHHHEIFIDSGRARYNKNTKAVQQKSAEGHNLPFVNHYPPTCESLVIQGNWRPKPYSLANVLVTVLNRDGVGGLTIKHNGYQRITPVKQHERKILLRDDLIVSDTFTGVGLIDIEIRWQLHPQFTEFSKQYFSSTDLKVWFETNANDIIYEQCGYHSIVYGEILEHPILLFRWWQVNLPFTATMIFKAR